MIKKIGERKARHIRRLCLNYVPGGAYTKLWPMLLGLVEVCNGLVYMLSNGRLCPLWSVSMHFNSWLTQNAYKNPCCGRPVKKCVCYSKEVT